MRPSSRTDLSKKYLFICDEDIEYLSVVGLEEERGGPRPLVQVVLARPAHHQLVRRHQFSARASLHRSHLCSEQQRKNRCSAVTFCYGSGYADPLC